MFLSFLLKRRASAELDPGSEHILDCRSEAVLGQSGSPPLDSRACVELDQGAGGGTESLFQEFLGA